MDKTDGENGSSSVREVIRTVLSARPDLETQVISARPEWVELRIPCDLAAVEPLQNVLDQLGADLPAETNLAVTTALREMLNNAIEHGCKLDRTARVELGFVRLRRAIVCWIRDPGEGFDPGRLEHAAISNPDDDPLRHMAVRERNRMRSGGFGILLTNQLVDELVYNDRHNELMFLKYLP